MSQTVPHKLLGATVDEYASIHGVSRDEAEVVLAQRTARQFAVAVRVAAADAYLIREGGRVNVTRSRRCPHGLHVVRRHYAGMTDRVEMELLDPVTARKVAEYERGGRKNLARVLVVKNLRTAAVGDVDVIPDFGAAFGGWGPFWGPLLAGVAQGGFQTAGWLGVADHIEDAGRIEFGPADAAGVSPLVFARTIRGAYFPESDRWCGGIASDPSFTGPVGVTENVRRKNINPRGY